MARQYLMLVLVGGLVVGSGPALGAQGGSGSAGTGVPARYAGNWVCQTVAPGYNILLPSADPSQPLTNKSTTPSTVVVLKFSLRTDGTYETATAKGHYRFDAEAKTLTWLDGPHEHTVTRTELGERENGAPRMGLVLNRRYYGCFIATPRP